MKTSGFLILSKPTGMTSRDVVNRVIAWFPRKTRLGHGGTLDPLATGVLVVAVGKATRLIEYVQDHQKTYTTSIILGADSDSDDADGVVTPRSIAHSVSEEQIHSVLSKMTGVVQQTPPAFSAAKIEGRRAYALARKGHQVDLTPRPVRIDAIRILQYAWPRLDLQIDCGKGTYIRSIARDLGAALGVGGYVDRLHRDRIGPFTLEASLPINSTRYDAQEKLLSMNFAIDHLPKITISEEEVKRIRFGQFLPTQQSEVEEVAILDEHEELIALGRIRESMIQPDKVFQAQD